MAPSKTRPSKDLLQLEHSDKSLAPGMNFLSICKTKKGPFIPPLSKTLPLKAVVGESSILHRVQAFLPVLSEANCKLEEAIKEKGPDAYDIEVLKDREARSYVEMDLALGVADLHSDKAISAAEKLVNGQVINIANSRIETDSDHEINSSDSDNESECEKSMVGTERRPKIESVS